MGGFPRLRRRPWRPLRTPKSGALYLPRVAQLALHVDVVRAVSRRSLAQQVRDALRAAGPRGLVTGEIARAIGQGDHKVTWKLRDLAARGEAFKTGDRRPSNVTGVVCDVWSVVPPSHMQTPLEAFR